MTFLDKLQKMKVIRLCVWRLKITLELILILKILDMTKDSQKVKKMGVQNRLQL